MNREKTNTAPNSNSLKILGLVKINFNNFFNVELVNLETEYEEIFFHLFSSLTFSDD